MYAGKKSLLKNLDQHREHLVCLALVIINIVIYWQVYRFDYVSFDDGQYIYKNPRILLGFTIDNIVWAFTSFAASNWHPLTWISFFLDMELFGKNPGAQHVVNTVFHIINSLLLYRVLLKLTGANWSSAFVAAIFAVHPFQVESVAWISERKNLLSTLFFLAALYLYTPYVKSRSKSLYGGIVLIYACGLMSKPMLVTFPFVLLLLDIWPLHRIRLFQKTPQTRHFSPDTRSLAALVREKTPLFFLSAVSCVLTYLAQEKGNAISNLDILTRLSNAIIAYATYLWKIVFPFHLTVFYPYPDAIRPGKTLLSLLLLLGLILIASRSLKKAPWIFVGFFWFMGTLVPVIGIIQVGNQAMADRYLYLPLIGIAMAVTWTIAKALPSGKHPGVFSLIGLVVLAYYAVLSYNQVQKWENSRTLFEHALAVTQDNYLAHDSLGTAYAEIGLGEKARAQYQKALAIKPKMATAWNSMGGYWMKKEKYAQAIACYQKALDYSGPENYYFPEYNTNMASALVAAGEFDRAIRHYRQAIQADPDFYPARHYLGTALLMKGYLQAGIEQFRKAYRIFPENPEIRNNLGLAIKIRNRIDHAVSAYQQAMQMSDPPTRPLHRVQKLGKAKKEFCHTIAYYKKAMAFQKGFTPETLDLDQLVNITKLNRTYSDLLPLFQKLGHDYPDDSDIAYHIACIYALRHTPEKSRKWLEKSISRGFTDWEAIEKDIHLQNMNPETLWEERIPVPPGGGAKTKK